MSVLLDSARTQLLVVDVQERLLPAMAQGEDILAGCLRLVQAAAILDVPVSVSEQYPKGIGPSVAALRERLPNSARSFEKLSFSCMGDPAIAERVRALADDGRDQVLICGIEAHVCVLQTAIEAHEAGLPVYVAADAVGSRAPQSRELALARMARAGVEIVTAEMAIFEWQRVAGAGHFKALMALVK
ncbi:MAG: hydrolase [Beijerinckiaceae bacterium]